MNTSYWQDDQKIGGHEIPRPVDGGVIIILPMQEGHKITIFLEVFIIDGLTMSGDTFLVIMHYNALATCRFCFKKHFLIQGITSFL